jgi:hypothetical protein
MRIEDRIPVLEDTLGPWRGEIGSDFPGYRNHVYRMVHFCLALRTCTEDERRKIFIAGCFHDLGIWSARTIDYLPPSIALAQRYLKQNALDDWAPEVELMIAIHHKLRTYRDGRYPLVEVFRRADLVDVSLGLVRYGIPGAFIRRVKQQFPGEGFHERLVQLIGGWVPRHPGSPLPFLKW